MLLPAECPGSTGWIHVPSGPSRPTVRVAPACRAIHTCTPPLLEPGVGMGTRVVEVASTRTCWCTGVSTIEPLLPAETTMACPGCEGPTWLARACSQSSEPSCGPKSAPRERLTTIGIFMASARSKRNATPRSKSSLVLVSLPAEKTRATTRPALGAMPLYGERPCSPLPAAHDATSVPWPCSSCGSALCGADGSAASMSAADQTAPKAMLPAPSGVPYFFSRSGCLPSGAADRSRYHAMRV